MRLFALVLVCLASASAFVAAPAGGMLAVRPTVAATPVDVTMGTMVKAKQRAAKSATRKIKCAHGSLPPFSTPLSLARLLTFFRLNLAGARARPPSASRSPRPASCSATTPARLTSSGRSGRSTSRSCAALAASTTPSSTRTSACCSSSRSSVVFCSLLRPSPETVHFSDRAPPLSCFAGRSE